MQQGSMQQDLERAYRRWVSHLARRVWYSLQANQRWHYDLEDLVNIGWLGLLQAWPYYDPGRGVRPITFVTYRVRGAIIDVLRADDALSQARRQQYLEVERVQQQLRQQHGCEPAIGEIAEALGVKEDEMGQRQQPCQNLR